MTTDSDACCCECQRPATHHLREERQGIYHHRAIVTVFYCASHRPLDAMPFSDADFDPATGTHADLTETIREALGEQAD